MLKNTVLKLINAIIVPVFLFCIFTLVSIDIKAQNSKTYKNAVELTSDNDAYVFSNNNDRYYTVGTGLKYYFTSKKLIGLEKLFSGKEYYFFSAGARSEAYTPTKMNYSEIPEEDLYFDRPFAGLLYATFDANYVLKRAFFKAELYLGVLGPHAYAENIQNWIHNNVAVSDAIDGWQYQLPDQLVINFNFQGVYGISLKPSWIDLYASGEARLGNLYIDASPTIGMRIGKFNKLTSSLSNGLFVENVKPEFYIKGSASVVFAGFNGTAQGRLLQNDFPYAIEDLNHFYSSLSLGLFITYKKISFSYENVFLHGEVLKDAYHNYGKFNMSYRF